MRGKRKPEGPDSARSWAIAASACIMNTLLSGIGRATGLFYVSLIETYGASRLQANLPFTIRNAVRNLLGPVAGAIGQRYGPRDVTLVGGVLSSLGIILCTFAPNVIWITILWGVIHGTGVAFGSILFQVTVTQYFEKYRATATGIALSGACAGSFFFPILTEYMLNNLGLAGSFLMTGGVVMHVIPAAIMLKEPPWIQRDIKKKIKSKKQDSNQSTISKNMPKSKSTHSMSIIQEDEESNNDQDNDIIKRCSSNSTIKLEDKEKFSSHDASSTTNGLDNPAYTGSNLELSDTVKVQDEVFQKERLRTVSIGELSFTIKNSPTEHHQEASIYRGMMKLFRDPMFHMISLSLAAFDLLFDPVLMVIVDYLMDKGLTESTAKYFIGSLSVGDLLGRLCFGWVTDKNYMSVSSFMMVLQIIQGLCFLLVPLFNGFYILMAIMVLYGVTSGANLVMYSILVGKYLPNFQSLAIGFINLLSGILSFAVPPLIGYFRDQVGSYDGMFYITGGLSAVTGVMWLLEPALLKFREKLEQEKNPTTIISL